MWVLLSCKADASLEINLAAIPEDATVALRIMRACQPSALAEQAEVMMMDTQPQDQLREAARLVQTWMASTALDEPLETAMPPEIAAWYGH